MIPPIDRAFVRLPTGLVHYRSAGAGGGKEPPILLLHGGPGSSAGLLPLIAFLARDRRVIAPDTPGCGASEPLPDAAPSIVDYAAALGALLDRLDVPAVDVYGHHTGAQIACELAIAEPARVRRMVLDGAALFPDALRREFLARYAPPIEPVEDGAHLAWMWEFASELSRHFPHYRRDDAHRVIPEIPLPPAAVTAIVADLMGAWRTWHLAYRAAFAHDLAVRLPLAVAPALVLEVAGDPLGHYALRAAALLRQGSLRETTREDRAALILDFMGKTSTGETHVRELDPRYSSHLQD